MSEPTRARSARETDLLARASKRLPGGVLGTYKYAADAAFVVKNGKGSKIYDVSGREYIDYVLASGPLVLGHAHPAVVAAVQKQIEGGSTYFMVNEPIIQLAEEICEAMPCAEQVRFTSTGSEATFFALRVARTYRQRDKILKFEGGYHGAHDYSMMSSAPRAPKAFPAPVPDSSGIPHSIEGEVLIAPFNDLGTVEGIIATHADELAAVLVEPLQRLVPPQPGFLQGLRDITRRRLMAGLTELVGKAGLAAQVVGEPVCFDVLFTDEPVVDYRAVQRADAALSKTFTTELVKRGVVKNNQKMYMSLVHSPADVATTLQACEDALKVLPKKKAKA